MRSKVSPARESLLYIRHWATLCARYLARSTSTLQVDPLAVPLQVTRGREFMRFPVQPQVTR